MGYLRSLARPGEVVTAIAARGCFFSMRNRRSPHDALNIGYPEHANDGLTRRAIRFMTSPIHRLALRKFLSGTIISSGR